MAATHGVKFVNQPLSPFSGPPHQAVRLLRFYNDFFLCADDWIKNELKEYVAAISTGELRLDEPWRFWRPDFHFRTNRIVLKLTDSGYLRNLFSEMNIYCVDFLRHPLHQAISCERNRWADGVQAFIRCDEFLESTLNQRQRAEVFRVAGSGDYFQKLLLSWILENIPVLRDASKTRSRVYFEDFLERSETIFRRLCSYLLLDYDRGIRAIDRPSYSTRRHSDSASKTSITSGTTLQSTIARHQQIDQERKARLQSLLDLFEVQDYNAFELKPRYVCYVPDD